jgi:hypothetical protein
MASEAVRDIEASVLQEIWNPPGHGRSVQIHRASGAVLDNEILVLLEI